MPYYKPIKRIKDKEESSRIADRLLSLRSQLDRDIPSKTATDTLLLATWNIRKFGDNRQAESVHYIAEIVSRFDLIAVQEISRDMEGLERLMSLLGPNWSYIVTDSTEGTAGGGERMAFIFDKNKVAFKNMAGEIVLAEKAKKDEDMVPKDLQFARTPFCVAFQAGWFRFNIATVHIYFGEAPETKIEKRRLEEIKKAVAFLAKRAKDEELSYILLGDFNIPNCKTDYMSALQSNKFFVPDAIKEHPSNLDKSKHYDQIAFNVKLEPTMEIFDKKNQKAGAFDFSESVYRPEDIDIYRKFFPESTLTKTDKAIMSYYLTKYRTFEMSDHLPLWVELKIDFSNQYLEKLR